MAVVLEQPWTFRPLTPLQAERVSQLARGEDVGVVSVPADRMEQYAINDSLMGKESMDRERWRALSAEEKDRFRHSQTPDKTGPYGKKR